MLKLFLSVLFTKQGYIPGQSVPIVGIDQFFNATSSLL